MTAVLEEIRNEVAEWFAAEIARGAREVGGNNRGPDPKRYLATVGLPEGHPWCAAMIVTGYDVVCSLRGMPLCIPRTGKVARLIQTCRESFIRPDPVYGAIAIHLTDIEDDDSSGHCGIVYNAKGGRVYTGEGNTDDGGGRDGDGAAYHWRLDSYWNGGFIDVGFTSPE